MGRSYQQFCGLARALDVVGDRWSLLIVRQLLVGPARYTELLAGLPGIATNLLADRLRQLEEAGVIEREPADRAGASTYALTPWGEELRGAVEGLIRWSAPLMARGPGQDRFQVEWLALALPALLTGRRAPHTIGVDVDGELLQVRATSRSVEVTRHDGRELEGVLHADAWTVLGLASGALTLDDAGASILVDGDAEAVRALFRTPGPSEPRRQRGRPRRPR